MFFKDFYQCVTGLLGQNLKTKICLNCIVIASELHLYIKVIDLFLKKMIVSDSTYLREEVV